MLRVCVVGGGTSGLEAAKEAARNGASVTVLERSQEIGPPKWSWPDLVDVRKGSLHAPTMNPALEAELELGTTARSVCAGKVVIDRQGTVRFDVAIIASGTAPVIPHFPGREKEGVFILDSPRTFAELGRAKGAVEEVVVSGEGVDTLRVAARLAGEGRRITLLAPSWGRDWGGSGALKEVLLEAAMDQGVKIIQMPLRRALGLGGIEAVVAGDEVMACDCLAVVPTSFPDFPDTPAPRGRLGGILVDKYLRCGTGSLYAAGECAELLSGEGLSLKISGWAAPVSGRLAGANSTGRARALLHIRTVSSTLFGLRLAMAGLTLDEARGAGFQPSVVSRRPGRGSACSICYDRRSGQVLSVAAVSQQGDRSLEGVRLAVVSSATIGELAYGKWSESSDISVVTETAREGLKEWRRY